MNKITLYRMRVQQLMQKKLKDTVLNGFTSYSNEFFFLQFLNWGERMLTTWGGGRGGCLLDPK